MEVLRGCRCSFVVGLFFAFGGVVEGDESTAERPNVIVIFL